MGYLDLQRMAGQICINTRNRPTASILVIPELRLDIYTLWPRRTLRKVKLEPQVGSITSTWRCRRTSELRQCQLPEKLPFFKVV